MDAPTGQPVRLLGLDVGSTTCRALVAEARIARNCVTGRRELIQPAIVFRGEPAWTPFAEDFLDEPRLETLLDRWLVEANVDPRTLLSGGVLITGLAAQARNSNAVGRIVRARLADALVVTAADPALESWLAFLGNCDDLSRAHPDTPFLNFDIGGGTTNPAWGIGGEVLRVGCYFVGARHVRVKPGTFRIEGLSPQGMNRFEALGIAARVGDELAESDVDALLDFDARLLEALVTGDEAVLSGDAARVFEQLPFRPPPGDVPAITFSGGVGELMYQCALGRPLPESTAFGDLGVVLARRLCQSPILSRDLTRLVPANLGRATVYGLTLHHADLSGATLFVPNPGLLPLTDLPVIGCVDDTVHDLRLRELLTLAARSPSGACLQIDSLPGDWRSVKQFGERLAASLEAVAFPAGRPLVLLARQNIGRTLGQYACRWGALPLTIVAIDEIPLRRARFVSLGRARQNLVPVSFYGIEESECARQKFTTEARSHGEMQGS